MVKTASHQQLTIQQSTGNSISADIHLPKRKTPVPIIVFCHGFKGFKDWGHFNWVAEKASEFGLAFLKFNFSKNGVVTNQLNEISDLEAFSNNNYSTEISDLKAVVDYVEKQAEEWLVDANQIFLVGHSRGGGIALLEASEDKRIKGLVLWASVSEFASFFRPETIKQWEKEGVVFAANKRTGVELPLKKQFYDDFLANQAKLDVKKAAKLLAIPLLIIHGDQDESVSLQHAENLYNLVPHSIFIKVEGGTHTFGAKHPFDADKDITPMLEELIENTFEFVTD
jgi:pimeloyl-ACP methyl ester carboxylesterase